MLIEKSFNTGEVVINYAEGPENGIPLVLLHGSTSHWQRFAPLIPEWQRHWHLYACDLRGHGKSGWADSGYRVVNFFPDTVAFVQRHIGKSTVLLGHSTGAIVALGVAAQIPELVRAIVLLDPPLRLRDSSIREQEKPYNWFRGVLDILNSVRTPEEVLRTFDPSIDETEIQSETERLCKVDPISVEVLVRDQFFAGFEAEQVLSKVTCPALMIYGEIESDGVVRESDVEFFRAHVSNSMATQIKGAGHAPHFDQPARVLELIVQFLNVL